MAILAAAIASAPFDFGLAILAGIVGAFAGAAARERASGSFEIGVSSAGEIELRESEPTGRADSLAPPVSVRFAAPWLISLRRGAMLIPIWPDCLPRSIFRQLWVHLRWGRAAPSDDEHHSTWTANGKSI